MQANTKVLGQHKYNVPVLPDLKYDDILKVFDKDGETIKMVIDRRELIVNDLMNQTITVTVRELLVDHIFIPSQIYDLTSST